MVDDAGHSIQGDKPIELARILESRALTDAARAASGRSPRRVTRCTRWPSRSWRPRTGTRRRTSVCVRRRGGFGTPVFGDGERVRDRRHRARARAPGGGIRRHELDDAGRRRVVRRRAARRTRRVHPPRRVPRSGRTARHRSRRRPRARRLVRARGGAAARPPRRPPASCRRPTCRSGPSTSTSRASSATDDRRDPRELRRVARRREHRRAVPLRRPVGPARRTGVFTRCPFGAAITYAELRAEREAGGRDGSSTSRRWRRSPADRRAEVAYVTAERTTLTASAPRRVRA